MIFITWYLEEMETLETSVETVTLFTDEMPELKQHKGVKCNSIT